MPALNFQITLCWKAHSLCRGGWRARLPRRIFCRDWSESVCPGPVVLSAAVAINKINLPFLRSWRWWCLWQWAKVVGKSSFVFPLLYWYDRMFEKSIEKEVDERITPFIAHSTKFLNSDLSRAVQLIRNCTLFEQNQTAKYKFWRLK